MNRKSGFVKRLLQAWNEKHAGDAAPDNPCPSFIDDATISRFRGVDGPGPATLTLCDSRRLSKLVPSSLDNVCRRLAGPSEGFLNWCAVHPTQNTASPTWKTRAAAGWQKGHGAPLTRAGLPRRCGPACR